MSSTGTSIISRRAFQKLYSKSQKLAKKPNTSSFKSKDESQWPKSLQILGYTTIIFSIPYSLSVIVAESRDMRSSLEERGGDIGQSFVEYVRRYLGHEEIRPYSEATDCSNCDSPEYQFWGEESYATRLEQAEIEKRATSHMNMRISCDCESEQTKLVLGSTLLSDAKTWGEKMSKQFIISFDDEEEKETTSPFESTNTDEDDLKSLTNIWPTWYHFPSDFLTASKSSIASDVKTDQIEIRIDELAHNISQLQKSLRDPTCTRDRDDMERELQEYQSDLRKVKREKLFGKFRKIVSR